MPVTILLEHLQLYGHFILLPLDIYIDGVWIIVSLKWVGLVLCAVYKRAMDKVHLNNGTCPNFLVQQRRTYLLTHRVGGLAFITIPGRVRGLAGRALNHSSLPLEFEPWRRHIWRVFHLWFRFITFGGRSKVTIKHQPSSSSLLFQTVN